LRVAHAIPCNFTKHISQECNDQFAAWHITHDPHLTNYPESKTLLSPSSCVCVCNVFVGYSGFYQLWKRINEHMSLCTNQNLQPC
jgi:hypothetical protein